MLASLAKSPFDEPGWVYEIKWDGFRSLAFVNGKDIRIQSRNAKSFNEQFYPLYDILKRWKLPMVIDGEIIVVNEQGISDFSRLQGWRSEADGSVMYYVFDLLWIDGYDLTGLPLQQRKDILEAWLPEDETIRVSKAFEGSGTEAFAIARKLDLEGLIAKKQDSRYRPGLRTRDWMKIKTSKRQEMVIGGYTVNEGSPKPFSSLLVGVYEGGQLRYTGKVGTGFNRKMQEELMRRFLKLETKKCPFSEVPDVNKPSRFRPNPPVARAVWLKPELVGEISYAEYTSDGVMRHPSFEGLRPDKDATGVVFETSLPAPGAKESAKTLTDQKIIRAAVPQERRSLLNPKDETQVRKVEGHELKFTNLSKIFWPDEGISKRDMLNYYYLVAPYILPYLQDRPLTLNRHPNGITGKSFYQKDVKGKVPDWLETFPYNSQADNREKEFLVCNSEASLMYTAALGCIEMNPWSSRIQAPDNPDWCIIDLDPDQNPFSQVIEAARVTHTLLEELEIPGWCKTSGSTGLHIYIPLGARYSYEDSKEFARKLAKIIHRRLPRFTSIERKTADRKGKLYIDFLQNRPQATVAGPYSLRPRPGATVSMPLLWEEVKKGLRMKDFTIRNAAGRLKQTGDLFAGVLGPGIALQPVLNRLADIFREEKIK